MEFEKDNYQKDNRMQSVHYHPDLFHNDPELYGAFKKIENISAAIFLVTGLIPDYEILKRGLREHALLCLNSLISLIGKSSIDVADLKLVSGKIIYMNSLLDIAFWSGIISHMNLTILQKEITSAYKTINDLGIKYKSNFFIDASFFNQSNEIYKTIDDKGQDKRHSIKDSKENVRNVLKKSSVTNNNSAPTASKENRRRVILDLLKVRDNLSVKDFSTVVTEFGEKTIQRELIAMVEEGLVIKKGERRWSTYSLKK